MDGARGHERVYDGMGLLVDSRFQIVWPERLAMRENARNT